MPPLTSEVSNNVNANSDFMKKQQKGKRMYYPSNNPEIYIVNAITGVKYPWKAGTYDSLKLYNVVDTTTICDNKGYCIKNTDKDTEYGNPNYLYYDSPEQYMQHRKVILDTSRIQSWHNFISTLFPITEDSDGDFDIEAYKKMKQDSNTKMQNDFKTRQEVDAEKIKNNTLHKYNEKPTFYVLEVDEKWYRFA